MHLFNKSNKHKKGQSIAEYSIFLAMVAVVLVGVILGPFRISLGGPNGLFNRLMGSIQRSLQIGQ